MEIVVGNISQTPPKGQGGGKDTKGAEYGFLKECPETLLAGMTSRT